MHIYYADVLGQERNCLYPHEVEITDDLSLAEAVGRDYVCALYENHYRNCANFRSSDTLALEFDNDHSEDPKDWILPQRILNLFPGVPLAIHYSRNHMKVKRGKPPRPKFHAMLAIDPVTDPEDYRKMKEKVAAIIGFADPKALDSAHFFYGTKDALVEFYPGDKPLDVFLTDWEDDFDAGMAQGTYGERVIKEGTRNATLSRFAGKLVRRFGYTDEAHELFLKEAEKCVPPLDEDELNKIWHSAAKTAKWAESQPGYIPPAEFNAVGALKPDDYSDVGQAKMIATNCADELAFTPGTGFLRFTGRHWEESGSKATGLVIDFLDLQLEDALRNLEIARKQLLNLGVSESALAAGGKTLEKDVPKNAMQAYFAYVGAVNYKAFVMKRRDMKYINAAMQAAKPMVEVDQALLDADENLLNCPDGTYDLRQGMSGRRDHDASDFITKITAASPGDDGADLWRDTLDRIFQGDQELIGYVQRIVGLAAIGEVYQEAMIIAYGDGSNGKSTFWNTIASVMGGYAGLISADVLTVGCKRNVKPELAEVKGMRLLIASELDEGQRLSTGIVKQLCSTDLIEGEKKYKDPFKFRPTHTLVLYTNHLPRVGASDSGIWRRLIVIPFNAKMGGAGGDIKNYSKFLLKNAGPAITKWIIEGAQKAIRDHFNLTLPVCVQEAINKYRADNDWLTHFLEECCVVDESAMAKSGEVWDCYKAYCARMGDFTRSTTEFYTALENKGFARIRRKNGRFVSGLTLNDATADFG